MIKQQPYTASVDVWSIGVLLYRMTVGHFPFWDDNVNLLFRKIVYADPRLPTNLSVHLKDLLTKMLTKDPAKRIAMTSIKAHPWLSQSEYSTLLKFCQARSEPRTIDPEIIQKMNQFGMAPQFIKQQLVLRRHTDAATVYRLLRRDHLIEELNSQIPASEQKQQ